MLTVFVNVDAKPGEKLVSDPDAPQILGYFQCLGVTANDTVELERIIRQYLKDDLGSELVSIDELWIPDFSGGDSDIADQVGDMTKPGIWYRSGHAFYGSEEEI